MGTMAKDWTAQSTVVNFRCDVCKHAWEDEPDLVEDAPDLEHHPFRYFGDCPVCHAERQPQAAWARALMKAHQKSTGPKTAEGLAKVGRNLEGHPNAEAVQRTRFNAMKHGMAAKTATYFPARPDKYGFCSGCDVNRTWCGAQAACVKQTEIFMLHHAAFESRNLPLCMMARLAELGLVERAQGNWYQVSNLGRKLLAGEPVQQPAGAST